MPLTPELKKRLQAQMKKKNDICPECDRVVYDGVVIVAQDGQEMPYHRACLSMHDDRRMKERVVRHRKAEGKVPKDGTHLWQEGDAPIQLTNEVDVGDLLLELDVES